MVRQGMLAAIFLGCLAAGTSISAGAQPLPSDETIKHMLVGFWTSTNDSPSSADAMARSRDWHGIEKFSDDGTGWAVVYKGPMCTGDTGFGYDFSWDVKNGIITTAPLHTSRAPVTNDRVISIDETRDVLFSEEHQEYLYRERFSGCQKPSL